MESARIKSPIRIIAALFLTSTIAFANSPTPPSQPANGAGGAAAPHAAVIKNKYGSGGAEYWLYEPDSPKPAAAPVIVFCHGWGGVNPSVYGLWIDHLVKRGNIVIYPRYQADLRTPIPAFLPNTINAVKDAIQRLQTEPGHVAPDLAKCAVVGHSVGGLLAPNLAAVAAENGLPAFRAVMSIEPGRTWSRIGMTTVPLEDLSKIPAGTLLLSIAGDADFVVRDNDAKRVFRESTAIAPADKNYIVFHSDKHGTPTLLATHMMPVAPDSAYSNGEPFGGTPAAAATASNARGTVRKPLRERIGERMREAEDHGPLPENNSATSVTAEEGPPVIVSDSSRPRMDAIDYNGLWKLFDALCDAAFMGEHRNYALGNTPEQRSLGAWSDGTPVRELEVITTP